MGGASIPGEEFTEMKLLGRGRTRLPALDSPGGRTSGSGLKTLFGTGSVRSQRRLPLPHDRRTGNFRLDRTERGRISGAKAQDFRFETGLILDFRF